MTDNLARIAEVLEDSATRATNAVQRQIMTSNAAVVRDAKACIEALTADNARLREALPTADELSNIIRTVDGNHSLGAGELAERILEALNTGKEVMPPVPVNDATNASAIGPGDQGAAAGAAQCCMCGKRGLSTAEDGGPECELHDGRWVCSSDCYDVARKGAEP